MNEIIEQPQIEEAIEQPMQEPPYPMPSMASSAPHAEAGALQYQLEGEEIVTDLINTFRGVESIFDPKQNRMVEVRTSEPLCNDFGVSRIRTRLMTFLRGMKVFALSDLDDDYIEKSIISLGNSIIDDISDNWNLYGMSSPSAGSDIVRTITDTAYAVMRKGSNKVYLRFLTKTHNVQETMLHNQNNSPAPQQGNNGGAGILDFVFGKKKRR